MPEFGTTSLNTFQIALSPSGTATFRWLLADTREGLTLGPLSLCIGTMAIAMGLHVRVGIEDNLWGRKGERMTSVQQVEQMVRISRELHRDVATGAQARRLYRIGEHYASADETLGRLGYAPNRSR